MTKAIVWQVSTVAVSLVLAFVGGRASMSGPDSFGRQNGSVSESGATGKTEQQIQETADSLLTTPDMLTFIKSPSFDKEDIQGKRNEVVALWQREAPKSWNSCSPVERDAVELKLLVAAEGLRAEKEFKP